MKILVFSDSHEAVEIMIKVAEREKADAIFHLGDHLNDAAELEKHVDMPVYRVTGNTDKVDETAGDMFEKFVKIGDKCFLLMHGHQLQNPEENMEEMLGWGKKGGADVILFGHTHQPFLRGIFEDDGNNCFKRKWLFNPGSIKPVTWTYCELSDKWNEHAATSSYGIIHLNDESCNLRFEIADID